ncbi:hypothetical protein, partial [Algoriphagus sp.]|uniref:Kazal-type serine protease inhibitor family protein n=2 Tax=Cyclobacteriaceae TaxID=563798 RepID=UPI00257A934B
GRAFHLTTEKPNYKQMKRLSFISAICVLLFSAFQCDEELPPDCYDSRLVKDTAACYQIYAPVCGCNGITYGNDCEARSRGITSFTQGTCGD